MKKTLFSTLILAALMSSVCVAGPKASGKAGKIKRNSITNACEDKCNGQGKRVDFQYSETTGECKCSTSGRAS